MLKNGTTSWRDRIHGYTIDHQTKDLKCHHWSLDRGPMVVPSSHTPSHHLLAKLTLSSEEKGIQTTSLILPKWRKKKRKNKNKKEKEQVKRGKKNFASLFSTFSLNFLSLPFLHLLSTFSLLFSPLFGILDLIKWVFSLVTSNNPSEKDLNRHLRVACWSLHQLS